jgi:hypothetical protein
MNELRELIEEYYHLSDDALKVVTQSLKSIGSNKFIDYNKSIEVEKMPVFLAKMLNKLESEGVIINFVETPIDSTYKYSYDFGFLFDGLPTKNAEEEIMSVVIEDIVNANKGKTMDLFSISVSIEKHTCKFLTYLRGNIHE